MAPIVTISAPSSADKGTGFVISGILYDSVTGQPIDRVNVSLYRNGTFLGNAETGIDGDYLKTVSIGTAGTWTLRAQCGSATDTTTIMITEPEGWLFIELYRGYPIYLWQTQDEYYGYWFAHEGVQYGPYSTLPAARSAIDGIIEPPPGEPYTVIDDFVVPESLPAGSDVNVRVLLRNSGGSSGYLTVAIKGNPTSPGSYIGVESGTTYPNQVAPGGSVWLDIYFRYYKMPGWDFNLTASNDDETSQISRVILVGDVPVGIPTTTTLSAPSKVGIGEKFNVSGILYETDSGVPIPSQPINHSYNGRGLGTSITGIDGQYLKEVSVPETGVWTLKSEFPGTEGLQASEARVDSVVAATPIAIALQIAGPIATAIVLLIYGKS